MRYPLQHKLTLPDEIEITEFLGEGGRALVYKAQLEGNAVAVKVYRDDIIEKYRDKYAVDIAEFEFQRNQGLHNIAKIKPYVAKPYRLYPENSEFTHSIVQEYVTGENLKSLIKRLGYLPAEILKAGYTIVDEAEKNGIHDMDISVGNIMVNQSEGKWKPKLYDFNLMPQYLFPPNPIAGLAIKLGLRSKSHRDYRSLKNWERRGKNKKWIGRN